MCFPRIRAYVRPVFGQDPNDPVSFRGNLTSVPRFADPDSAPVVRGVDVVNSTLVKVTWSPIPKDRVHGRLKGYQVFIPECLLFLAELVPFLPRSSGFRGRWEMPHPRVDIQGLCPYCRSIGGKVKAWWMEELTPNRSTPCGFQDRGATAWSPPSMPSASSTSRSWPTTPRARGLRVSLSRSRHQKEVRDSGDTGWGHRGSFPMAEFNITSLGMVDDVLLV